MRQMPAPVRQEKREIPVMSTSIFEGFEAVEELDGNNAVQLVYGVNVLRVDAEVKASRTGTVGQMVAAYREQLGLPQNVVVFVDGVKLESSATIPADARRIDVVKPAGEKGSSDLPIIPLTDEEAIVVELYARDITFVWETRIEELGTMSDALLDVIALPAGVEVIGALTEEEGQVVIGRLHRERVAEHVTMRQLAHARRRPPLSLNDLWSGASQEVLETLINEEVVSDCCDLAAGWEVVLVVDGQHVAVDLEDWTAHMQAQARAAYQDAIWAQDLAMSARQAELEAMGFFAIRKVGKEAGIRVAGLGRTAASEPRSKASPFSKRAMSPSASGVWRIFIVSRCLISSGGTAAIFATGGGAVTLASATAGAGS